MKALTWQGPQHVEVQDVPDPRIEEPTDIIVKVTSSAICGSDLHLYSVLGPYLEPGDVLGHEFMGIVEEVGSAITTIAVGDRVVIPFNISCGHCWMCQRGFFAQCETTQNTEHGTGASLFGYTALYGQVPGGQAEYVRVPHADFGPMVIHSDLPDERFLYLSDILPTAWQGVKWAEVTSGDSLAVMGAGPVGQLAAASAFRLGLETVIVADYVPERLERMAKLGAHTIDLNEVDSVGDAVRDLTAGRGADGVVDAVGMEAHGDAPVALATKAIQHLPEKLARKAIDEVALDRLSALHGAIDAVRRGGTVSLSGVYGGAIDPMPMMQMFDKGISMRMGQCHVKQWTDALQGMLEESDAFGVDDLATHRVPLDQAPEMYSIFQKKQDGCQKVVLKPGA